jgi:hypothetical protein
LPDERPRPRARNRRREFDGTGSRRPTATPPPLGSAGVWEDCRGPDRARFPRRAATHGPRARSAFPGAGVPAGPVDSPAGISGSRAHCRRFHGSPTPRSRWWRRDSTPTITAIGLTRATIAKRSPTWRCWMTTPTPTTGAGSGARRRLHLSSRKYPAELGPGHSIPERLGGHRGSGRPARRPPAVPAASQPSGHCQEAPRPPLARPLPPPAPTGIAQRSARVSGAGFPLTFGRPLWSRSPAVCRPDTGGCGPAPAAGPPSEPSGTLLAEIL